MTDLPAFFEIAPPPPELQLDDDDSDNYGWRRYYHDRGPDGPSVIQAMPEMGWEEARAALNRLLVDHEKSSADCVRLAGRNA